jgi:catechol-2,3-dioxygenase
MSIMQPTRLMMVTVQVRDFDLAVAWYRDVLGLSVLDLDADEGYRLVRVLDPEGNPIGITT